MPTPPKPFKVLTNEKKSHRTKAELLQRKQGEESLLSGKALTERPEVKSDKVAHKEFRRINDLLKRISKNDAIYEPVINRYCMLQAECKMLEDEREKCIESLDMLKETFSESIESTMEEDRALLIIKFTRAHCNALKGIAAMESAIQAKRKMLLDIEKENVMTIKAALQSIPKKQEEKKNALLEALGGGK